VRVVDVETLQAGLGLQQQTVGARRQGTDCSPFDDLLGQQGAVRGTVEEAQAPFAVEGHEALAALLGNDLGDRCIAQLEAADMRQHGLAVGITDHEPLADTALAVTDHQRDPRQQRVDRADLGIALEQGIAPVEALAAQVEDIGGGLAIDHEQPLLARVDDHRLDRLGDLRQVDAGLVEGDLAGHHVLFTADVQQLQLGTDRATEHQAVAVLADSDMFQRTALRVEGDRRLAEGVFQLRRDGLDVVRVGDLVDVLEHQHLAVGQAQRYTVAARLVLHHRDDAGTGRQGQLVGVHRHAVLEAEELHLAAARQAHGDLVLLFHGEQQSLALLGQPGRLLRLAGLQVGATEHRCDHVGEVEENQGDTAQHGQAANGHVPARHAVLEGADAPLALQDGSIEIDPVAVGSTHAVIGQVIHEEFSGAADTARSM